MHIMRTNIDIDDATLEAAMKAGPWTKKEAVEAGLKMLARRAAYQEILKWRGKLRWDRDDKADPKAAPRRVRAKSATVEKAMKMPLIAKKNTSTKSSHGRR
jgi:antitoxin ParD1/3/4